MPTKVLLRCDRCKGFHAAYLVDDPQLGRQRLCYRCWRASVQRPPPAESPAPEASPASSNQPEPAQDEQPPHQETG